MVSLLMAMQLAFTYWSPLQQLFGTAALPAFAWGWCLLVALALGVLIEAEKWLGRRFQRWPAINRP